jgi:DNA-binding CsgD family transcriptional regulator
LPTDLKHGDPAHCIGREQELAYLRGQLHDAALGTGSITILAGGNGSGKSRLLHECAKIDSPVKMIRAQCTAAPMPGQDLRSQIKELPALIRRKAVALLVDDVHLAASEDLQTLEALAVMTQRHRFALVATVIDEGNGLVWSPRGACCRAVGALSEEAVELLVRGLVRPHPAIAGNVLREIVALAQGNPRYAIELAECALHVPSAETLVPPSARRAVEEARRELSPAAFDTLLLCSTLGDRFDDRLLENVSQRSMATIVAALQEACDAGVLAEDTTAPGVFSFRHAAVQKATYLSMISPKRRLLHERIQRRLSASKGNVTDAAFLAYQWDALQDHQRAAAALTAAADHLAAERNFAAAANSYERALKHLDVGVPEWFAVGASLVECYEKIGNHARMIPLVEEMRSREGFNAHRWAARLLDLLFFAYLNESDWDGARGVTEQMATLNHSSQSDHVKRAQLVLAYAYARAGHPNEAARLMRSVEPRALSDDESRWRHCLAAIALDAGHKPLNVLLAQVDRAAELGRKVGVAAVAYAYTEGVEVALAHGDLAAAERYNARAMEAAERSARVVKLRQELVKNGARLCLCAGRLAAARALLVSNLGWRDLGRYNEAFHAGIGVFVGMRTGDIPMVDAFFDPALLSTAASVGDAELCGLLLPGFAEVMYVRGMTSVLQRTLRSCLERGLVDRYLSVALCAARYASADLLDLLDPQIEAYLQDTVTPIAPAHAALVKAIVSRRRGKLVAAHSFALTAAAGYGTLGWRLYEAFSLEHAGDLRNAARIYRECDAKTDAARVASGQRRKLKRAPFGAQLTQREREVAGLIARERSDREIARALSISVRTVHHHVEAIFSKLGVQRRAQLNESLLSGEQT